MNELGAAERALLARVSDAHDPSDADRARVRAALAARLGTAAGLGVGAALGAAATAQGATAGVTGVAATTKVVAAGAAGLGAAGSAAAAGTALVTKVVLAVALTATVGVGATVKLARHGARAPGTPARTERHGGHATTVAPRALALAGPEQPPHEAPPEAPPVVAPAAAVVVAPAAEPRRPAPPASPAPAATLPDPPVAPAPTAAAPPSPLRPPAPEPAAATEVAPKRADPTATSAAAPPSDRHSPPAPANGGQACGPSRGDLDGPRPEFTVADEARLVHDGVRALHEGQPACALTLLDTHAHFYPRGVLAEERDAERALALAQLGRMMEARAAAAAFLRAHPASPLGARLRQSIPGLDVINHDMRVKTTLP